MDVGASKALIAMGNILLGSRFKSLSNKKFFKCMIISNSCYVQIKKFTMDMGGII